MKNLVAKAWIALFLLVLVMGLLLFVPAGTLRYWQAWVYLTIFCGSSVYSTLYLTKNDPALLKLRMRGGPMAEKRPTQKLIMLGTSACFIALLIVPGFDHRFGWSVVSLAVVAAGDALVTVGFYFILLVYRENTFTSATIEIVEGQSVISSGPYAIVRHPMYASALLYLFGTPLALGSYCGVIPIIAMLPFLIWRLLDEERFLSENLRGYTEYRKQVRSRLVPFVW